MKHRMVEGLVHVLYGEWHLKHKPENIIITEGVFDYWSAIQLGYPSLALTSSSMSAEQFNVIVPKLRAIKNVYLCLDTDLINKAGQQAAWKLAGQLRKRGIITKIINLEPPITWEGSYDLSDLFQNNHNLNIESAKTYDQIRCNEIHNLEDLENFLRDIRSCSSQTHIEAVKVLVKQNGISSSQFNAIYKSVTSKSENEIANLVLEQSEITYNEAFGFVEYMDGCWYSVTGETIDKRVADILGEGATGARLRSTRVLIAAKCELPSINSMSPFNIEKYRKYLVPFKNGCLNTKTWTLEGHRKEAYFTFQLPLDYEPQAECPRWEKFIEEVTANDHEQMDLLQEIFGYAFLPDNSFQKFFVMFGEGANGKTRYLEVLQKIMGSSASSVPLSAMSNNFSLADLYNKNVNISSEDRSDIANSATIIKAISSGDLIRAERKFKASFSFVPHCKIIVAMNEYPRSNDASWGFFRRIEVIHWPVKFVDANEEKNDICPPNVMPKDMNLDKTLENELSGIVNWALIGLKRLIRNSRFTRSQKQMEQQREFRRSVDVVETFFDAMMERVEFRTGEYYARSSIYNKYRIWCEENGYRAFASSQFFKRAYSSNLISNEMQYKLMDGRRTRFAQILCGIDHKIDIDVEMEKQIEL